VSISFLFCSLLSYASNFSIACSVFFIQFCILAPFLFLKGIKSLILNFFLTATAVVAPPTPKAAPTIPNTVFLLFLSLVIS